MEKVSPYQLQSDQKVSDISLRGITEGQDSKSGLEDKGKERNFAVTRSLENEKKLKELTEMKKHFVSIASGKSH